jgi:hypothetical protein
MERVRRNDPVAYLRTVALLDRPAQHVEIEDDDVRHIRDDELRQIMIDGLHEFYPDLQVVQRQLINQQKSPSAILRLSHAQAADK